MDYILACSIIKKIQGYMKLDKGMNKYLSSGCFYHCEKRCCTKLKQNDEEKNQNYPVCLGNYSMIAPLCSQKVVSKSIFFHWLAEM